MKFKAFFFLLALHTIATATPHLPPCHGGVFASLLYLSPNSEDNFGPPAGSDTQEIHPAIKTDYKPGFRLEGVYATSPQNDLHARFTYFHSPHYKFSGVSGQTGSGPAEVKEKYKYISAELLFGRWLCDTPDFNLALQFGALFSKIDFREILVANQGSLKASATLHTQYWGIGPEIVLDLLYPIPCFSFGRLAVAADMRAALLTNKKKFSASIQATSEAFSLNETSEPNWSLNPASDLRIGLNWFYPCSCFATSLDVGYEWIFYHKAKRTPDNINSFGFNGPYLELGVTF